MYNEDNKPKYITPLFDQYDEVEFVKCGYSNGSWVKIRIDNSIIKIERTISYDLKFSNSYAGNIKTNIKSSDFDSVHERDRLIGEKMIERLGGYDNVKEAFEQNFKSF
jgi:hypothetical protein